MSRSMRGLHTVLQLKQQEERLAAQQLQAAQARLEQEEARLDVVQGYIDDYHAQTLGGHRNLQQLRDSQRFYLRLQQTLQAQTAAVARERQHAEAARAQWIAARLQREALDKLIDRRALEQQREQNRAEQRLADERALRGGLRIGMDPVG